MQQVDIGPSAERTLPGQRFEQHDAKREDIAAAVQRPPSACSGDMYTAVPTMNPARVCVWVIGRRRRSDTGS